MSDIKPGDLVVVVRHPCCGKWLGRVREVVGMQTVPVGEYGVCDCATRYSGPFVEAVFERNNPNMLPTEWLKRIPPLDEIEHETLYQELIA